MSEKRRGGLLWACILGAMVTVLVIQLASMWREMGREETCVSLGGVMVGDGNGFLQCVQVIPMKPRPEPFGVEDDAVSEPADDAGPP